MKFRNLVTVFTFLAVFTMAVRVAVDTDTWWHLKAGEWIVQNHEILRFDPFSLTRQGEAWEYPGWLAQISLYGIYSLSGYGGLNLFTAIMVMLAFGFAWKSIKGSPLLVAAVLLLAAAASGVYWAARPHIISFALTGFFIWMLERHRKSGDRWIWSLPLVMIIWSNVHGGFAIGFLLIILYMLGEMAEAALTVIKRERNILEAWLAHRSRVFVFIGVGLCCAAAVCLNPHGPEMLLYPFKTVSIGVLREYIQEWQSPDFHAVEVQPFALMIILIIAAFAWTRDPVHPVEFLLVAVFAIFGLLAARNIALFALVASIPLARHLESAVRPLVQKWRSDKQVSPGLASRLNVVILALLFVLAGLKISIPLQESVNEEAFAEQVPLDAVAYLEDREPLGNLFNSYNWGGYVIWALTPEYLSFVDGRTDLFSDEILTDYIEAWRGSPTWEATFDSWEIEVVLIESWSPLEDVLIENEWVKLFEDDQAVVLARPSTQ